MKKFLMVALEVASLILAIVFFVILTGLFILITPDQCGAECDALREEMHQHR